MDYIGRLNSIEFAVTTVVSDTWLPNETEWKGSVAYSTAHKTAGKEYDYKTTTIASGDTYGNTPKLIKKVTRVYSAKFTKSGKNYQNYREHVVYTMSGFLSCLDASEIGGSFDPDKNTLFCKGFKADAEHTIREPNTFNYIFNDVDTKTVNKQVQISNMERNTKGHIKRNRVATNIADISVSWVHLTEEETSKLLTWVSNSEYLRIGFYNPVTGENVTRAMANNQRGLDVTYRGRFTNVNLSFTEV